MWCSDAKSRFEQADDSELVGYVQRRRTGWELVLSLLLKRHQDGVVRRCLVHLRNRQDAEDATQETLLRAARAIRAFNGSASFRTWLYAIADNQCRTLAVRRSRRVMTDHLRALIEMYEMPRGPESEDSAAMAERVRQTLYSLTPQARDVVVLRFYGELSLEDIAKTLGLSLSAAKMRLYRALEQFARCYGPEPYPDLP